MVVELRLDGKTAVVTGAASGIGREIVLSLSEADVRILAVDRDGPNLEKTCSLAGEASTLPLAVDLLDGRAPETITSEAIRAFGRIDVLVNCAGVFPSTPAIRLSAEEWDRVFGTNVKATFLCAQAAARRMIAMNAPGSIINIASSAGVIARPGAAHYCASKAAVIMLTKVLAIEWAEHDIRVNAVAPGLVETAGVEDLLFTEEGRREHERKISRIPLARTGEPREIADAVIFLASDAASFVTGHTLFVDGGYSAGHTFRG
jgi:NAD(P)-dependent dehydrogenase (short-subunit alcohol dehydrogenase family)